MTEPLLQAAPALAMRGMRKSYAGVTALDGCDLVVEPGTIHGLVGQNGAGKSTLIKLLAGLVRPDGGTIELFGRRLDAISPAGTARLGIGFIHQDRLLVPSATVAEALFLGREPRLPGIGLVDRRRMRIAARQAFRTHFDLELPLDALVSELTTGQQKIVQITRALIDQPSLLVFDEPTAALVSREVEHLAATIRRLRQNGITVLYVSHYLDEIERLCDQVTVLRNGASIGRVTPRDTSLGEIVSMMVGRNMDTVFPKHRRRPGPSLLRVQGLGSGHASDPGQAFHDIGFDLRQGEILGVTGVLGCGGKTLLRALFGTPAAGCGTIELDEKPVRIDSPRAAIRHGVAFVPEDRRAEGVIGRLSVRENATLASLDEFRRRGLLDRPLQAVATDRLIARLGIRTSGREQLVSELSGGNQQKVALGKWLRRDARVYLLDEPTVGVDIAAKVEIYTLLAETVARGAGALVFSSDLEELLGLADRILVLYRGRIAGCFEAAGTDASTLLACATGAHAVAA